MTDTLQLLGISNAIVDILTHVEDSFLEQIGAPRGSMMLIDAERAHQVYLDDVSEVVESHGRMLSIDDPHRAADTCAVDTHPRRAVRLSRGCEGSFGAFLARHVALDR